MAYFTLYLWPSPQAYNFESHLNLAFYYVLDTAEAINAAAANSKLL